MATAKAKPAAASPNSYEFVSNFDHRNESKKFSPFASPPRPSRCLDNLVAGWLGGWVVVWLVISVARWLGGSVAALLGWVVR